MRVIAKSTLKKFWEHPHYGDARGPLESWYEEARNAAWTPPQAVKEQYRSASICGNNRVVFNIGGNKYRLVVEIQYRLGIVWVKFIGTHARYDSIDVENVNESCLSGCLPSTTTRSVGIGTQHTTGSRLGGLTG